MAVSPYKCKITARGFKNVRGVREGNGNLVEKKHNTSDFLLKDVSCFNEQFSVKWPQQRLDSGWIASILIAPR